MPNRDPPFLPSVFDRLLEPESAEDWATPRSRAQQLAALRNGVRRDLEELLNTHHPWRSPPADMPVLQASLREYGIPDFFAANAGAAGAREAYRDTVERIIRRFEPRFKSVAVTLRDDGAPRDRTLRFSITALMYAEPAPEPVTFDSHLDPANHSFAVLGSGDG